MPRRASPACLLEQAVTCCASWPAAPDHRACPGPVRLPRPGPRLRRPAGAQALDSEDDRRAAADPAVRLRPGGHGPGDGHPGPGRAPRAPGAAPRARRSRRWGPPKPHRPGSTRSALPSWPSLAARPRRAGRGTRALPAILIRYYRDIARLLRATRWRCTPTRCTPPRSAADRAAQADALMNLGLAGPAPSRRPAGGQPDRVRPRYPGPRVTVSRAGPRTPRTPRRCPGTARCGGRTPRRR